MMIIVLSCIFMADEEKIGAPGGRQGSALTQPLSPPATAGLLGGMAAPTPAPGAWRGVAWPQPLERVLSTEQHG